MHVLYITRWYIGRTPGVLGKHPIYIYIYTYIYVCVYTFNSTMSVIGNGILYLSVSVCVVVCRLLRNTPYTSAFTSSPPGKIGRHFGDDIFRCIFVNKILCIFIQISLKCLPKGLIDYMSALVLVMAWCLTGNEPLPEPMMTQFTDTYMRH